MSGFTETIAGAYAFEGASLDLGRGVHDGKLEPNVVVRLPHPRRASRSRTS